MRLIITIILFTSLFSCSKSNTDDSINHNMGNITGTIKTYDRYGNTDNDYSEVTIKLFDKQNKEFNASVDNNGFFSFEKVGLGKVILTVNKPRYDFIDTVAFNHQKPLDTIKDIVLIEKFPFSIQLISASYINGAFAFNSIFDFSTDDTYMVSTYLCFSKDSNVSINHKDFLWDVGNSTHVQHLGSGLTQIGLPPDVFKNAGFKIGDKVYVSLIVSIRKFWEIFHVQDNNYQVLHYKIDNASNTISFIVNE